jgi:hypothetical protein
VDNELQFLVHFFNDQLYLFKTVTMAEPAQVDEICDAITAQRGWYSGRFAQGHRQVYLRKRRFVEQALYEDYTREYGSLKAHTPVFFYLYPGITEDKALAMARERARQGEVEPQVLLISLQDLTDTRNITFTLNDSHTAYWQRAMEAGITSMGGGGTPVCLPDHNRVFPFARLEEMYKKYRDLPITFEVQVWDYQLLEQTRYRILEKAEASSGKQA